MVNIKGGVGKTVSAINIAACLSDNKKRVLVVDCDSQGNLSQSFNRYDLEAKSISDDLTSEEIYIPHIVSTGYDNIDILPSNLNLASAERKMITETESDSKLFKLSKLLDQVELEYDYCIIDCAPNLSLVTLNALVASDEVLVPIKIDQYALDGLGNLIDSISDIRDKYNSNLTFKGCFITMDTKTNVNKLVKEQLKVSLQGKLLNTVIRNNVKVIESTFEKRPVVYYAKSSPAAKDYKDLVKEIIA